MKCPLDPPPPSEEIKTIVLPEDLYEYLSGVIDLEDTMNAEETLKEAGYSELQITKGLAYADQTPWRCEEERGRLALARILFSDEQLRDGYLPAWEPRA